jgi:predicted PurR-regulated permease PerM
MGTDRESLFKTLFVIAFGVILYVGLQHLDVLLAGGAFLLKLLRPFLLGLGIAFILNVPMTAVEGGLTHLSDHKKGMAWLVRFKRGLALLVSLVLIGAVVFLLLFMIVPEFQRTLGMIFEFLPGFFKDLEVWLRAWTQTLPFELNDIPSFELDWKVVGERVSEFLGKGGTAIVTTTVGITSVVLSTFVNGFLGFVFALYVLLQKELLTDQFDRLFKAYLPPKTYRFIVKLFTLSNQVFANFVRGQFLEALIIGVLCFIGMVILSMPYALVVSSMVGLTALIPIFGAFIGIGLGAFLILIVAPVKAFWFVVFIIILQNIEGNLIYPRVVGHSVGLPGIWVLAAVTLGGGAFGLVGMLVGVPLSSVVYSLLREDVSGRIERSRAAME